MHVGAEPQLGYLVLNLCARDYSHLCFLTGLVAESVVQHQGDQPNPAMCFSSVSFHWICPPTISMQIHFRIPNISVLLEVRFAICCHWKAFEILSFFLEGGARVSLGLCFQVSVSSFASKINAMYSVTVCEFSVCWKTTFPKQSKHLYEMLANFQCCRVKAFHIQPFLKYWSKCTSTACCIRCQKYEDVDSYIPFSLII